MAINRVNISGNLVRDAELKVTSGGTAVCHFTVAVNERRRNQSGEWEDYANFIDCTLFGTRAEKLAQWLSKGQYVAVDGRLSQRRWEAKDGTKRSALEVNVDNVDLGPKSARAAQQPAQQQGADDGFSDEDIPF